MHKEGNFPIEKIVTKYPVVDFQRALRDLKDGNVGFDLAIKTR